MCSLEHDQTTKKQKKQDYDAAEIVTILVFVNDKLSEAEKSNLYRDLWKWFEDRCLPPLGLKID